jgi:hypothetical protein
MYLFKFACKLIKIEHNKKFSSMDWVVIFQVLNCHKYTFPLAQKFLLEAQISNNGPSHWTLSQDKSLYTGAQ